MKKKELRKAYKILLDRVNFLEKLLNIDVEEDIIMYEKRYGIRGDK